MSSTSTGGANLSWLPFTLISFTEWERPWVNRGFAVVWLVLVFEFELATEFELGLEAEFVQLAVVFEPELELELVSCEVLTEWPLGLGMDLDRSFALRFDVELWLLGMVAVISWSLSRMCSIVDSGEDVFAIIPLDLVELESETNWLADWERTACPPNLSLNAIW